MWMTPDALSSDPELLRDGRKTLELLDEQMASQGASCSRELLEAYDTIRAMLHLTDQ